MTQLGLNLGGWIFLISAWCFILFFMSLCFYKVLISKSKKADGN